MSYWHEQTAYFINFNHIQKTKQNKTKQKKADFAMTLTFLCFILCYLPGRWACTLFYNGESWEGRVLHWEILWGCEHSLWYLKERLERIK